ncbi:hypothetical protein F751_0308 [Auxenochlorella protothecoides]|uniref:Uncharacterized protein n=1 Tax=Auxenochlorella protothecoides TaxID=3075 RepID=A0A087SS63_AUXPR|nr:hypothetical protein F751_0308 [Auxenochlorella protothecoides]KFM28567.1 hypothetical protein F751_0308 [Auxenochlorella protothecoides]
MAALAAPTPALSRGCQYPLPCARPLHPPFSGIAGTRTLRPASRGSRSRVAAAPGPPPPTPPASDSLIKATGVPLVDEFCNLPSVSEALIQGVQILVVTTVACFLAGIALAGRGRGRRGAPLSHAARRAALRHPPRRPPAARLVAPPLPHHGLRAGPGGWQPALGRAQPPDLGQRRPRPGPPPLHLPVLPGPHPDGGHRGRGLGGDHLQGPRGDLGPGPHPRRPGAGQRAVPPHPPRVDAPGLGHLRRGRLCHAPELWGQHPAPAGLRGSQLCHHRPGRAEHPEELHGRHNAVHLPALHCWGQGPAAHYGWREGHRGGGAVHRAEPDGDSGGGWQPRLHRQCRHPQLPCQESEPVQPPSVQGWRAGVKWTEFYVSDRDACSAWTPHSPLKLVPAFDNVVHYTLLR